MRRPKAAINMIVTGKKGITAETATELASAFGTSAEFWLNLDSAYRLSKVEVEKDDEIRQRAGLFSLAPIKDMQKRGWIKVSDSLSELEAELKHFFSTDNLSRIPDLKVAARTSASHGVIASPEQKVWCFQALRRAKDLPAAKFSSTTLSHGLPELRGLAAFAEEARKVPRIERYLQIETVLELDSAEWQCPIAKLQKLRSPEDAERLADEVRDVWKLGIEPIPNMTELLEEKG
jgi:HTH-type transcriptional regulator / antitoxin HigA